MIKGYVKQEPGATPVQPCCELAGEVNLTKAESLEKDSDGNGQLRFNNKICRVCGDKALNVNFNVVTCESCKAFFRRNALKPKEFRCPFSGSCEVTAASRKFCKKCRLRKCFEVGMMKEWIMTDEARLQKRQLIEINREKRRYTLTTTPQPDKKHRRSAKLENLNSPTNTSCSASSDERQLDTPAFYKGYLMSTTRADGTVAGWTPSTNDQPSATSLPDDDSIMVPKSVLLKLIKTCQENNRTGCSRCSPPPVLLRAIQLYETGSSLYQHYEQNGDDVVDECDVSNNRLPLECICSCVCGARCPGTGVGDENAEMTTIEDEKDEKMAESSMDVVCLNENAASAAKTIFHPLAYNRTVEKFGDPERRYDTDEANTTSALYPYMRDARAFNAQCAQELVASRRAWNGLSSELGYDKLDSRHCHTRYVITEISDALRLTQAVAGRIVMMCKMLARFRALSTGDQIALLRGGMRELMMIHSTSIYNYEVDAWSPFGRNEPYVVRLDMIKRFNADLFEQHANFIRSFAPQWSSDEILVQSMVALCLFNPNRRGVTDSAVVQRQQQFYCDFMKEYLLITYGNEEGVRVFGEIQARLNWLRGGVDRMQPTYHLELSPSDLRLLMFEILL